MSWPCTHPTPSPMALVTSSCDDNDTPSLDVDLCILLSSSLMPQLTCSVPTLKTPFFWWFPCSGRRMGSSQRLTECSPKQDLLKRPCVKVFEKGNRQLWCWLLSVVPRDVFSCQIGHVRRKFQDNFVVCWTDGIQHLELEFWPKFWTRSPVWKEPAHGFILDVTFSSQLCFHNSHCLLHSAW